MSIPQAGRLAPGTTRHNATNAGVEENDHRTFFKSLAFDAVVDWRHARRTARVAEGIDRGNDDQHTHTVVVGSLSKTRARIRRICGRKHRSLVALKRLYGGMAFVRRGGNGPKSDRAVVSVFK